MTSRDSSKPRQPLVRLNRRHVIHRVIAIISHIAERCHTSERVHKCPMIHTMPISNDWWNYRQNFIEPLMDSWRKGRRTKSRQIQNEVIALIANKITDEIIKEKGKTHKIHEVLQRCIILLTFLLVFKLMSISSRKMIHKKTQNQLRFCWCVSLCATFNVS